MIGLRTTTLALAASLLCLAAEEFAPLPSYKPAERRHWAFQPRQDAKPPVFTAPADKAWVKTPIDAFILDRMKKAGLRPAPAADRATLIRRATFDLHGLPPTIEEVDAFVNDRSPNAWEKVVDRLLASPRYGEQWARHWLDVVRFAETEGFEYDMHRPDGWRYRDYVVDSLNADKPYNQFVLEQLAGDELKPDDDEYLKASGFNRLGPVRKNAGNQEVASSRTEVLTEMTNAVGAVFLGVTLGCARCHDHKFDPFRQSDYYRIQGYFAQLQNNDVVKGTAEEQKAWRDKAQPVQRRMMQIQRALGSAQGEEKIKLEDEFEKLESQMPAPLEGIFASKDDPKKPTPIYILERGEYTKQSLRVGMRPLGILMPEEAPELPLETEKPRTLLARWIVDPAHPLTARVMVNRVWQYHFGQGIVSTANDFGRMGTQPSNPQLLDWLANTFIAQGWTIKPLHRMMMLSSAYRQAGQSPVETIAMEKDSSNALLWKFSERRLDAEEIRDSMLFISGRLNAKIGGPSVMVPIEPDMVKMLKRPQYWAPNRDKSDFDRRTLYMIHKRNLVLPFMQTFDAPDLQLSCPRREQSTHAPQALELLNGAASNDLAAALAGRLLKEKKTTAERVEYAFRLATGRRPSAKEQALAIQFLSAAPEDEKLVKEFALAVMNLNAFLYVN